MSNLVSRWTGLTPQFLSVLRIVAALMFLQAGTMKLFGWPMAMPGGSTAGLLYCFIWLYFYAAGAGPGSLDALRKK